MADAGKLMEDKHSLARDVGEIAAVGSGGLAIWHLTPEQFAALATGAYFTVMTLWTLYKWWKDWRKSKKG